MKTHVTSILLLLSLSLFGQKVSFRHFKTILTDLNQDNRLDTIILSSSIKDPVLFNQVSVSLAGSGYKTFRAKTYWTVVDTNFLKNNKNAVRSKFLYISKTAKQSALLLFGNEDEVGRDEFSIITISDNKIQLILDDDRDNLDIEIPVTLKDIDHDGTFNFVFKHYGEITEHVDSLNYDIGTYQPFFVYNVEYPFTLNKALTKKYNEEHYVFAGFKYNDHIRVRYPRNGGKPQLINNF